jgi:hypothetical protein
MRYARRFLVSTRRLSGVLPLCAAFALGCHGEVGSTGPGGSYKETPICDANDPTQVVAPQRIALLTSTQLMNMISLVSPAAAKMIVDNAVFPVVSDLTVRFPPPRTEQYKSILDVDSLSPFNNTAQAVGDYVTANFAAVTGCSTPATDSCAQGYLNGLAKKVYRRALNTDEQSRFANLYTTLKSQLVNGYQVTLSVEEATGSAVYALYMTPQMLWRFELGGQASTSPAGVYLTDGEIASNLSFFLSDQPPDDMLVSDAAAGTLRGNIGAHVDRLLKAQMSKDWLRHIIELYFFLNQLPSTLIDEGKFPIVAGGAIFSDLQMSSRMFLDNVMWNGKVLDMITSRTAFVNNNLATMVYNVPVPAGATATNFVATTLPSDKRAGIITDAGFITTRARSIGVSVVPRGLGVKATFLCLETAGPPKTGAAADAIKMQTDNLANLTAQEQVQFRQQTAPCNNCHPSFDPYGLVLDWYDVVGRYREVDDLGKPVDGHTTLPAAVGGQEVNTAVELADVLSKSDLFMNCMTKTMLQYALLDNPIELPLPDGSQKGCAVAGIAHNVRHSNGQSFSDLTKAVATSPAFVVRQMVQ